jgi:hypothetical protein
MSSTIQIDWSKVEIVPHRGDGPTEFEFVDLVFDDEFRDLLWDFDRAIKLFNDEVVRRILPLGARWGDFISLSSGPHDDEYGRFLFNGKELVAWERFGDGNDYLRLPREFKVLQFHPSDEKIFITPDYWTNRLPRKPGYHLRYLLSWSAIWFDYLPYVEELQKNLTIQTFLVPGRERKYWNVVATSWFTHLGKKIRFTVSNDEICAYSDELPSDAEKRMKEWFMNFLSELKPLDLENEGLIVEPCGFPVCDYTLYMN